MASQQQGNRDGNNQRKILEDLQMKKQMMMKQGVSQALSSTSSTQQTMGWSSGTDGHIAGLGQRSGMNQVTQNSFGYFVQQDSAFGNFILPVLPRLEPPK